MMERLLYLGATHKTAAVALRERLAAGPERLPVLLAAIRRHVDEAVVLSTCGRFEVYAIADEDARRGWAASLGEVLGQPADELVQLIQVRAGSDAALHLMRVAAGLESQIVGEEQILGQVRAAFDTAARVRAMGPVLSALFRGAIHAGRRVRRETRLGRGGRSFARSAVNEVCRHVGAERAPRVLILGSGQLAHEVTDRCREAGIRKFVFVSRHPERARMMAARYGGIAFSLEQVSKANVAVDAVIGCAGVRRTLVDVPLAEALVARRNEQVCPVLFVDLGMPRNIEAGVGDVPGATLRDLDTLGAIETVHDVDVAEAEAILSEEMQRFRTWLAGRAVAPRIVRLLEGAEGLTMNDAREVRRSLHGPIIRLKEEAAA